jgi:glycosyltransferase involved in cell wall biosynthesis
MYYSVIIPLYNKRKYIRRSVYSVLGQTFSDFELIVVDDGSNDGSSQEIEMIIDNRLHIINKDNGGVGSARNRGITAANGKWVVFLDADDAWYSDHLSELSTIIKEYPESGMISTKGIETTELKYHNIEKLSTHSSVNIIDYFLEASKNIGIINASTVAIRRDICEKIGGFLDYKAGEDLEYWARVALKYPVAVSDRVTSLYFRDTGGTMQQINNEKRSKKFNASSLRDFSASIATICDEGEINSDIWKNSSIRSYINSRIYNAIKGALYRDDVVSAREYSVFIQSPFNAKGYIYKLFLGLPDVIVYHILQIAKFIKKTKSRRSWRINNGGVARK